MSARVIVTGYLGRTEQRLTKHGETYIRAMIIEDGARVREWSAFIFTERLIAEIGLFGKGEEITVEGPIDATIFAGRVSLRIKVGRITRPSTRQRAPNVEQATLALDEDPSRLARIANGFRRFHAYMRDGAANANDN
jgi:hypothetical protein